MTQGKFNHGDTNTRAPAGGYKLYSKLFKGGLYRGSSRGLS